MSVKNKLNDATRLTEAREKAFIKSVKKEYDTAYKGIRSQITEFIDKHGVDGKLNQIEAMKYQRLEKLQANILDEIRRVENLETYQIKTFLKDSYEINYYHTAYAIETEARVKLAYSIIDRKQVAAAIESPLMNGALADLKTDTRSRLRRHLTQSVVKGDGIQKTAAAIKRDLEISGNKATQIARTETTRIMGDARQRGFQHAADRGIELQREWVATLGSRTRDTHGAADGQRVGVDEPFDIGGSSLMYPGDSRGPVEEVVNCRCTVIAVIPDIDYDERRFNESSEVGSYKTFDEWKRNRI